MSKLVPKLRFKEFSGEWEEIPILDIASMKARIGWQNLRQDEHLEIGEYYLITGTDFKNGIIDWNNAKYVEYERYLQDKHIILKEGDILITKDGTIGKLGYVQDIKHKKATLNNGIFRIRIKDNNTKFMYYTFLSINFKKFLDRLSAGSSISHLYQKDFKTYKIIYPSKPEQQKIASCLSSLDSLIEAQNKKVEALKKHKKGLMQQLFPKECERVPTLRFDGFSGEWEKKSLLDIAKFRRGSFPQPYGLSKWYDDENGKPFIQVFDVDKNLKLKPTTKRKISKLGAKQSVFIPEGTLIITIQGSIGRVAITQYNAYIDRTLLVFEEFYNEIDKLFFAYIIENLFEIEKEKAPGGIIKTITKEVLSGFIVKLPNYQEQQKIASCFFTLDRLIEAQNKKVEALKKHKKGLMQQMFVSEEK